MSKTTDRGSVYQVLSYSYIKEYILNNKLDMFYLYFIFYNLAFKILY